MMFSTPDKDRFCKFTHNPMTGEYERDWIEYSDGVFEPVRKNGSLRQKWDGERCRCQWWHVRKPADWMPQDHGHGFSWNHDLGDGDKPADWGDKSQAEIEAGSAPYFMEVETGADNRIESRTERIDGRRETWDFQYDDEGRLTCVSTDTDWVQEFQYDEQGRRSADHDTVKDVFTRTYEYGDDNRLLSAGKVRYEHDEKGFRCTKIDGEKVTRYQYAEDYRLLGASLPDGRTVSYEHDEDGQRSMKLINSQPVEAYDWLDFIRLGAFFDGERELAFNYEDDERLPYSMTVNGSDYALKYDQVGTLKAVVSPTGNVVKAIQYDVFGNLLWDSNPGLRIPLGFAGGLSDPDTGFVRFGWRDYDPDTGRWTAQDPIGDAGGDDDWYGYCLDDPINATDANGLNPAFAWTQYIPAVNAVGKWVAEDVIDGRYGSINLLEDGLKAYGGYVKGNVERMRKENREYYDDLYGRDTQKEYEKSNENTPPASKRTPEKSGVPRRKTNNMWGR